MTSKKKAKVEACAKPMLVWEKKGGWEVCCKEILDKLLKNKRAWPFTEPVDPKALGLKDYKKIVKKPMDLGTVGSKLEQGGYTGLETSGEEFYKDVMLTFDNALLYNDEGDEIWEHAGSLKATMEELWAKLLEPTKGGGGGGEGGSKSADRAPHTHATPSAGVGGGAHGKSGNHGDSKGAATAKGQLQPVATPKVSVSSKSVSGSKAEAVAAHFGDSDLKAVVKVSCCCVLESREDMWMCVGVWRGA